MVQTDSVFSCSAILQSFIEMAEAHPKMMKPYLPNIIDTMFVIMNNEVRRCVALSFPQPPPLPHVFCLAFLDCPANPLFFSVFLYYSFQEVDDELRKLALETTTTLCEGAAGMMRKQENFSGRMVFTLFKVRPPLFIPPDAAASYKRSPPLFPPPLALSS
jgi:hypothetical protein